METEIDLAKSRTDLATASRSNYDTMVKTLSYQWELDSVACKAIAPLLAPFVTNSELWAWLVKQSEIEVLHTLTYSEIIRQCIVNPNDIFNEIMNNQNIIDRSSKVTEVFDKTQKIGAMYTLDKESVSREEIVDIIVQFLTALIALEAIEFMASFAVTFGIAEQNIAVGIAQYVQKIATDEQLHAKGDGHIIKILLRDDPEFREGFKRNAKECKEILDSIVRQELSWNKYLFSEGRSIPGLTEHVLNDWVLFCSRPVYTIVNNTQFDFEVVETNPITWIKSWLDIDSQQNANQEQSNNNYQLNMVDNNIDENEDLDFDF